MAGNRSDQDNSWEVNLQKAQISFTRSVRVSYLVPLRLNQALAIFFHLCL